MSFIRMPSNRLHGPRSRSYGTFTVPVKTLARIMLAAGFAAAALGGPMGAGHGQSPIRIVALGDSLTAGFGLPVESAFPARLQAALAARGLAVEIVNAGVS